jgi:hypothetical protein
MTPEEQRTAIVDQCCQFLRQHPPKHFDFVDDVPTFMLTGLGRHITRDEKEAVFAAFKKEKFSAKAGKRQHKPIPGLAVDRVRLKLYPEYAIDKYGMVFWLVTGELVPNRWRNKKCWVRLYDHTGKRCEKDVFWLMVGAGFAQSPKRRGKGFQGVPAAEEN